MSKQKSKAVGRPRLVGKERKVSRTVSITPSNEKAAIKQFGNLGNAVLYAINAING